MRGHALPDPESSTQTLCPLTDRELAVVSGVADGLTYAEIAVREQRSLSTIRSQLSTAYHRLGVTTSSQAAIKCFKAGWLHPDKVDRGAQETARLTRVLERVADLLTTQEGRWRLTAIERVYLGAFDDLLAAHTDDAMVQARTEMRQALGPLLGDTGASVRREGDLVERLVRYVIANRARERW